MTDPPEIKKEDARLARQVFGCLSVFLIPASLVWLWLRDDMGALAREAVGAQGQWLAMGVGVAVGVLGTVGLWGVQCYVPMYRDLMKRITDTLGPLTDQQILRLALLSAIGEELFFRLAVQQALGFWWSVGLFVALNTGPGFWAWSVVAFGMGWAFSSMVDMGYGLLSVTVAHALINYLTLRRLLLT